MTGSTRQKPFTASEGRHFGLTIGAIFVALAAFLAFRNGSFALTGAVAIIGALLMIGGLVVPSRLAPVYRGWMGMAAVLSRVTTPIVIGLMYFLMIMPVGLLRRAFGRNALIAHTGENGFWVARTEGRSRSMRRQF
jgi:hypothetical protein